MPRSTLCVPDNACSLAIISTVMVVLSESEKLFSCVMIMSENVDVEEEFTLASNVSESKVLSISSITCSVCPFSKVICFLSILIENGEEKGIGAFIVEKDTSGLRIGKPEDKMGWKGSDTRSVYFEDMFIPKENIFYFTKIFDYI